MSRSPYDIPAANECPDCKGRGVTAATAQMGERTPDGYVTTQQGYGCLECLGIGRLPEETK